MRPQAEPWNEQQCAIPCLRYHPLPLILVNVETELAGKSGPQATGALMMKPRVYVETTVIGYLTSWPSGDLVVAGHQKATRDWWSQAADRYDLVVSELVLREGSAGDPQAVEDRLKVLKNLPVLGITDEADELARTLIRNGAIPQSEPEDALHIAAAVVNGLEYLVTWNFKHIANPTLSAKISGVCAAAGYEPVTICTPEALLET